jgi:hypothetical protein
MPVERTKKEETLIIKDVGSLIITIRNQKVIVDRDLAEIYGVETRRLNEQVKRNPDRFPEDFMFQLTREEADFPGETFCVLKEKVHRIPNTPPRFGKMYR